MKAKTQLLIMVALFGLGSSLYAAEKESDTLKVNNGKEVVITFIKHVTFRIVYDKKLVIDVDPEDIPEMHQLKDIDIAFLPVNQPYTMLPAQAIRVAKIIKPKILYPYHYGKTKIEDVKEGLASSGIDIRIRKME